MIERWLNKIRAWLEAARPSNGSDGSDGSDWSADWSAGIPARRDALWRRFLEDLASEGIAPDYRELADLLWLEQWMARRAPSDDADARDIGIEDRRQAASPRPAPSGARAAGRRG